MDVPDDHINGFYFNIVEKRESYMACICYRTSIRRRINHLSLPILLGSDIDSRIRGLEALKETHILWGSFILEGTSTFYTHFSTFQSISTHPRIHKGKVLIEKYAYFNGSGLALKYNGESVMWVYNKQSGDDVEGFIDYCKKSNPFEELGAPVNQSDYFKMYNTIIENTDSMNTLTNRLCLNAPAIMKKYTDYDFKRRSKFKANGFMRQMFESGQVYATLSKQCLLSDYKCKSYPQNYNSTLHDGRSDKLPYQLAVANKSSSQAIRNSPALKYPQCATGYYCSSTTKDLKSAGEQSTLTDFTITNEKTDPILLFYHLRHKYKNTDTSSPNILVIDGQLINVQCTWSLTELIDLKKRYPHVTTNYTKQYVEFATHASVLIKYSEEHDVFFSPSETTHFQISYPDLDYYSCVAKVLGPNALLRSHASKTTVSINNIKGSVAKLPSRLQKQLMRNTLGTTCYSTSTEEAIRSLKDLAIISLQPRHDKFDYYNKLAQEKFNLKKVVSFPETNPTKARIALTKLYELHEFRRECQRHNSGSKEELSVINDSKENIERLSKYLSLIYSEEYYKPQSPWNLSMYVTFNDYHGGCIEDGIIIDSKTIEHIDPIKVTACITVEFSYVTAKEPKEARFLPIKKQYAQKSVVDNAIGILQCETVAEVKNSKHTNIKGFQYGQHFYYIIEFLPNETEMYDNIEVSCIFRKKSILVVIKGERTNRVCIGSKLANAFGQKNIISGVADLSPFWGQTASGKIVHAQLMYNPNSLVGRRVSGQIYEMLTSPDVAYCPDGGIIAPLNLVIHNIHPYINYKIIKVKIDTLTSIMGFDAYNLSFTSNCLRTDVVWNQLMEVLGYLGFEITVMEDVKVGCY